MFGHSLVLAFYHLISLFGSISVSSLRVAKRIINKAYCSSIMDCQSDENDRLLYILIVILCYA